jgi:hypothetical protein
VLAWYVSGLVLIRDLRSHIHFNHLADIFSRECDFYWSERPPFSAYPLQYLRGPIVTAYVSQAAKDVRASRNTLLDIFERIEMYFRRLEVYTEVEPTPEMMDTMAKITVEVLSILGIATEEIKPGRTSE